MSLLADRMSFDGEEILVGEIRGFRWWDVTSLGWLRSPWHARTRWKPGRNVASCLRPDFAAPALDPHERGSPNRECICGFYALHHVPTTSPAELRHPWEVSPAVGGSVERLAFGVVAASGHVLIGETGWRAEVVRVMALYLGRTGRRARRIRGAGNRYDVPVYRDLDAMVREWGPDADALGLRSIA